MFGLVFTCGADSFWLFSRVGTLRVFFVLSHLPDEVLPVVLISGMLCRCPLCPLFRHWMSVVCVVHFGGIFTAISSVYAPRIHARHPRRCLAVSMSRCDVRFLQRILSALCPFPGMLFRCMWRLLVPDIIRRPLFRIVPAFNADISHPQSPSSHRLCPGFDRRRSTPRCYPSELNPSIKLRKLSEKTFFTPKLLHI